MTALETRQVYGAAAPIYRDAGWAGVLPLPAGLKASPPSGYTGHDGKDPDAQQVHQWCRLRPDSNVGLRMPETVIGIDVDQYDKFKEDGTVVPKRGADQLEAIEAELGVPLPATWVSSARDEPSGVRLFRVPAGCRFVGELTDSIEILQRGHRYAVVWPSTNPEAGDALYRWRDPHGFEANRPPTLDELPELPAAWIDRLTDRSEPEVRRDPVPPRPVPLDAPGRSKAVQKQLDSRTAWTQGARHPQARRLSMALARLEDLGHPGAGEALDIVGGDYINAVEGERGRNPVKEWDDLVAGARKRAASTAAKTPDYSEVLAEKRERDQTRRDIERWMNELGVPETPAPPEPSDVEAGGRHVSIELIDWAAIHERPEEVVEGLVIPGRWTALASPAKTGKSLLLLAVTTSIARGMHPFSGTPMEPVTTLYVDAEMGRIDLAERLDDLGLDPLQLTRWHATDLPPRLDTPAGGAALVVAVQQLEVAVVVIDGINGTVSGPENDDTTWRAFFDHTVAPLKRLGVAVLTGDNHGKDKSLGPRGSSVKVDKPDAVLSMTRTDDGCRLVATHRRSAAYPESRTLRVEGVNDTAPVRYCETSGAWPAGTKDAAMILDRLGVPVEYGRDKARRALADAGEQVANTALSAAIRWRRAGGVGGVE